MKINFDNYLNKGYRDSIFLTFGLITFLFMVINLELGFNRNYKSSKLINIFKFHIIISYVVFLLSLIAHGVSTRVKQLNNIKSRVAFFSYFIYLYYILFFVMVRYF